MRPTPAIDVLHVTFGALGGQTSVVRGLIDGMRRRGLSSAVCAYAPPALLERDAAFWPGVAAVRAVPKRSRIDIAGARAIGAILRELRPRAVLWHSAYAPAQVLRARTNGSVRAVVLVEHTALALRDRGDALRSLVAMPIVDAVVVLTDRYRAGYRLGRLAAVLGRQVSVVPNGIDTERFTPRQRPASEGLRVGMAARLTPNKDFETLVTAVARLREDRPDLAASLVVAGEGPMRAAILEQVDAMGLAAAVRLLGTVAEDGLSSLFGDLDVYVQSSHGETLSTAVLQAWGAGLPVVVPAVPGLGDLVRDGQDGLLVRPRDAGALAAALAALADDPELARRLGAAGRRRVEAEHSVEAMTDGYLAVLSGVDPSGPWAAARSAQ